MYPLRDYFFKKLQKAKEEEIKKGKEQRSGELEMGQVGRNEM